VKAKLVEVGEREKALAVKRNKSNEINRRQRQRIVMDPDKHEMFKAKERDAYRKRKVSGKLKGISDMNRRAQAKQRRKWRANSKKYFERKRQRNIEAIQESQQINSQQKETGRKRAKLSRERSRDKCMSLTQKCLKSEALAVIWKRRYYRACHLAKG